MSAVTRTPIAADPLDLFITLAEPAQARARVVALKQKLGSKTLPETIVVDEAIGRSYNEHTYRHLFSEVCALAIKGSDVPRVPACPTLTFVNDRNGAPDFKHDQYLRDTCVILLDRAENDLQSICDVTGHSGAAEYEALPLA